MAKRDDDKPELYPFPHELFEEMFMTPRQVRAKYRKIEAEANRQLRENPQVADDE